MSHRCIPGCDATFCLNNRLVLVLYHVDVVVIYTIHQCRSLPTRPEDEPARCALAGAGEPARDPRIPHPRPRIGRQEALKPVPLCSTTTQDVSPGHTRSALRTAHPRLSACLCLRHRGIPLPCAVRIQRRALHIQGRLDWPGNMAIAHPSACRFGRNASRELSQAFSSWPRHPPDRRHHVRRLVHCLERCLRR